jgi:hypothetical protein
MGRMVESSNGVNEADEQLAVRPSPTIVRLVLHTGAHRLMLIVSRAPELNQSQSGASRE